MYSIQKQCIGKEKHSYIKIYTFLLNVIVITLINPFSVLCLLQKVKNFEVANFLSTNYSEFICFEGREVSTLIYGLDLQVLDSMLITYFLCRIIYILRKCPQALQDEGAQYQAVPWASWIFPCTCQNICHKEFLDQPWPWTDNLPVRQLQQWWRTAW